MLIVVVNKLTDDEINEIERRLAKALGVAPSPWEEFLETRHGIGGSSFIRVDGNSDDDHEMYVSVHRGGVEWTSPDERLDAVLDFLAHAAADIPRLMAEVKRLRDGH
jgi:hypothetical protein